MQQALAQDLVVVSRRLIGGSMAPYSVKSIKNKNSQPRSIYDHG